MPLKIVYPVFISVALFVTTLFWFLLPSVELHLMDRKREMIRELTELAWSTINYYATLADKGMMNSESARRHAIGQLRNLRFGPQGKDYFWINDMHPRIVMHPYRPDLEGRDTSNLTDPTGKHLFMAFVKIVRNNGAGYVDYQWQWQDNPDKIVEKISYVKGFTPWGWVVGTGVYVQDVRDQISAITRRLTIICIAVTVVISMLSFYIVLRAARNKAEKRRIQEQARVQREQLHQSAKLASLGTLVSGVAHEINNPISAVMLNIQILEKFCRCVMPIADRHHQTHGGMSVGGMDYGEFSLRMPLIIQDTLDGVGRIKRIVADLKDYAGQRPTDLTEHVDINDIVKKATGLTASIINKASSDLQVQYGQNLPLITGNGQRIEQVVINLLVNACQAMAEKRMPLRVATGFDAKTDELFIEVQDHGTGMTPEVMERITDPFFTTKRDSGGTGLGISISDTIIRDHGGRLIFKSIPGRGTLATIRIPRPSADPQSQEAP